MASLTSWFKATVTLVEVGNTRLPSNFAKASLCEISDKIEDGPTPVYKLPLTERKGIRKSFRHMDFLSSKTETETKVILLVGQTGVGKTTLINAMVNYVCGVEWDDPYRFKLIMEANEANQAVSQTEDVTVYTIHHQPWFKVPFSLKIIDTPGFGDTKGLERDENITKQIKELFSIGGELGVDQIDLVGFVVQMSNNRLSAPQQYIFDCILSLFGKDIASNIVLLVTFCDSNRAPAPTSTTKAKIPKLTIMRFNNSALYRVEEGEEEGFAEIYWKMGFKNLKQFFNVLQQVQTRSLTLTARVLEERHKLNVLINGISKDIRAKLIILEQMTEEQEVVMKHEAAIEDNKDFLYTSTDQKLVLEIIPDGQHITNCSVCNHTCHEVCYIALNEDKHQCWAMTNGVCRICPKNCSWVEHGNYKYKYVIHSESVTKTYAELKTKYDLAQKSKVTAAQLLRKIKEKYQAMQKMLVEKTNEARDSINRLKTIALKPDPLTAIEYIDILVDNEERDARPGWNARRNELLKVRENMNILQGLVAEENAN